MRWSPFARRTELARLGLATLSYGQAALRLIRAELAVVMALGLLGATSWSFMTIADEVVEGETRATDERILLALRNVADPSDPIGPRWFEEMMRDFTALGGIAFLSLLTLAICGWLLFDRRRFPALVIAASVAGGMVLSLALKFGYARPRPDLVPHGSEVYTASFPSGHAMMSAAVYLTLGVLLARVQPGRHLKIYFLALAVLLTVLVGISRVYLGVHWPSDVLAGWSAGAAWATLCWLATLWAQRRAAQPEG
ncbi:phosphatase PAP2 family protein [Geminicoccaceae bacterium 1502E]|nr:phosphatase PAP2 family protein [Geminicoccaceae bacterium 1502E]